MNEKADAEGWYRDPYEVHEARWFSAGAPTSLVRDEHVESRDEPPDHPPAGPLVEIPVVEELTGDDVRRADEVEAGGEAYDPDQAAEAALDASVWAGPD